MATPAASILQTLVGLISAVLYIWVARIVLEKDVEGDAKRANTLFALWWLALAILYLLVPFYLVLPQVFGYRDLALGVTLLKILFVLLIAAIWGLVYYLVYLYTGDRRWFWPIATFYFLLACGCIYTVNWLDASGFNPDGTLAFGRQLVGAPALVLGLVASVPVVGAAIAYGSLFFRVQARAPRYRIGMIAGAFLVQFGWSTFSTILRLPQRYSGSLTLALVSDLLGVLSAIAILFAFRPPHAIRMRLTRSSSEGDQ